MEKDLLQVVQSYLVLLKHLLKQIHSYLLHLSKKQLEFLQMLQFMVR